MGWNCKPNGGYAISSVEGTENINLYYTMYQSLTGVNNVIGQLCNVYWESGLNPWRWEGDVFNTHNGYGLYQYTPATGYINLSGYPDKSPNMSTSQVSGGTPNDAKAQIYVFQDNALGKWIGDCWRPDWDPATYPDLYAKHTAILNRYASGPLLSLADFYDINDIEDACFAFMACFERPGTPNFATRLAFAPAIEEALHPGPQPPGSTILYGGVRDVLRRLIIHA